MHAHKNIQFRTILPINERMKSCLFVFIINIFLSALCYGDGNTCVNRPLETSNIKNNLINDLFKDAKDPLIDQFRETQKGKITPHAAQCPVCVDAFSTVKKIATDMKSVVSHTNQIKKECIEKSLQRQVGNKGYFCGKKRISVNNSGDNAPCYGQDIVDYIHYAVNQGISCASSVSSGTPIDPRFILKKINNETGFNFFVSYDGGKGISQLTSDPVMDLVGWYDKNRKTGKREWVDGPANHILTQIVDSKNPACTPFAKIIKDEINMRPPPYPTDANSCTWVGIEEGIARNIIYGLSYYVYLRDEKIPSALRKEQPKLAGNSELINTLTLVSYGPKGFKLAESIIDTLRVAKNTTTNNLISQVKKQSTYIKDIEEKMFELAKIIKPQKNYTVDDLEGRTCVD